MTYFSVVDIIHKLYKNTLDKTSKIAKQMNLLEDKKFHKIYELNELANGYDAIFFDIWGVLHEGGDLYPGVRNIFNQLSESKIVRIISNAPRLRSTVFQSLSKQGLNIAKEHIFTSGETTRNILKDTQKYFSVENPSIYHLGEDRNKELLHELDIKTSKELREADLILLSAFRDHSENYNDITHEIELAVAYNIPILCANPDTEVLHLGQVRKCSGYFAHICEKLGGKVFYSGKPELEIFNECASSFDYDNKKILMIGDTFHTDIKGARNANIDSALVLTGNMRLLMESKKLDTSIKAVNQIMEKQNIHPDYIVKLC